MNRTQSGTDGRTDGRTVRLLYASQSSFGDIKRNAVTTDNNYKITSHTID